MNEVGLEVFDERAESPVAHPRLPVSAGADTGELVSYPEVRWAGTLTRGDIDRVGHVHVDALSRRFLP